MCSTAAAPFCAVCYKTFGFRGLKFRKRVHSRECYKTVCGHCARKSYCCVAATMDRMKKVGLKLSSFLQTQLLAGDEVIVEDDKVVEDEFLADRQVWSHALPTILEDNAVRTTLSHLGHDATAVGMNNIQNVFVDQLLQPELIQASAAGQKLVQEMKKMTTAPASPTGESEYEHVASRTSTESEKELEDFSVNTNTSACHETEHENEDEQVVRIPDFVRALRQGVLMPSDGKATH